MFVPQLLFMFELIFLLGLRLHATSYGAKITINQTSLVRFAFTTRPSKTYQGGMIFCGFSTMYCEYP